MFLEVVVFGYGDCEFVSCVCVCGSVLWVFSCILCWVFWFAVVGVCCDCVFAAAVCVVLGCVVVLLCWFVSLVLCVGYDI